MTVVHVLGNPAAAGGRPAATVDQVVEAIEAAGHDARRLDPTSRADALALAYRAVEEGAGRLVVVGGDGLVHLATQAVAGTRVVLGIVPVGTGNDFARGLGLDTSDPEQAVARALGDPVRVDAIRTSSGWIASVATVGFSVAVNARANRLRRPRGPSRYTIATLLELPRLAPIELGLELDGVRHDVTTTLLAIANTAYFGGGMAICPSATPQDGRLDIAVIGPVGRATLLRMLPRVFKGTHVTHPAVTLYTAACVRLLDATAEIWGDGEPVGRLPIDLAAVPGALRVAGVTPRGTHPS
jgi:diacylglycerol kinase (ATP)